MIRRAQRPHGPTSRAGASLAVMAAVLLAVSAALTKTAAAAPSVAASIKPVHSLVAAVMGDIGEPALIVKGGGSPHSYSLRPSEARAIRRSDLVFWMGEELETFLAKPLRALSVPDRVVTLSQAEGLRRLPVRAGGWWGTHQHRSHEHHGNGHDEEGPEDDRHRGELETHLWLDPFNAMALTRAITASLSRADPANAAAYQRNARATVAALERLHDELARRLEPARDVPYVVFHDAYHDFEARYGLNAVGAITVSPERKPGARRIAEMRTKIKAAAGRCVFAEPQFEPAIVRTLVAGTGAKAAVLDPLGAELSAGPELYPALLRAMADVFATCLSSAP